ncbi:ATP-binding protein [Streptosporangium minutum]|uniref:IstB-like ATP-binding domain-containing protein n=1 Tax=Streptosporangium minutum TaxID=569862 RepID=A0A243RVU7_9ACTN|nr:ATP-binding protein [Streptosporangium minutum]OUC99337.1 hypothetical protein CA984_03775 [Streptosporangium minutum]
MTSSSDDRNEPISIFRHLPVPTHPEGCSGDGWVNVSAEDGHLRAARCPGCQGDRIMQALLEFIPPRFRKPITLPPRVEEWTHKGLDAEGLYITGSVGVGKTHTAYTALAAWCLITGIAPTRARVSENYGEQRRIPPTVKFVRATTLFDELRPSNNQTRQPIVDSQKTSLLVIDDIGAEKPSEFTAEKLYEIVDERYAHAKPFIVTSNVPPKALADQVGARVASRFSECCDVVPMTGPDRRKSA